MAVGVISLLFAGIQGSEAARLESDRITTQGIVVRKFRARQMPDGTPAARIIEVRYLEDAHPTPQGARPTDATNSLFEAPAEAPTGEGDRPSPDRNWPTDVAAMSAEAAASDAYRWMQIEVLSASLFDRLQTGAVVDFSYRLSDPDAARLSVELPLWRPPLWQYGVMGVTFGGAAYFFLKALFLRRSPTRQSRR